MNRNANHMAETVNVNIRGRNNRMNIKIWIICNLA